MSRGHFIGLDQHRIMLADEARMSAYQRAIEAAVVPGMRVLDLGTGTGILALWAAARGADVVAVEPHDVIAVARRVAADNGLAARIRFHQGASQDLTLDHPVDLVITECMGNFFVTDEMQPVLRDLPRHMAPGAATIPRAIRLRLAGVALPAWREVAFWREPIGGLDYSGAADFALQRGHVVAAEPELLLTEPVTALEFPLVEAPDDFVLEATLVIRRAWRLSALLGWFEADLGHGVTLSTAPGIRTHWGQMAFPVPETPVVAGDQVVARVGFAMDAALKGRFFWSGTIARPGREDVPFDCDTARRFDLQGGGR